MKKLLLIGLILITVFITGCWDMIEVNQRIFPYVVGIDLNNDSEKRLKFTFSYPNINALGKNPTQDEKIYVVIAAGNSGFEGIHHLDSKLQYPMYIKLLKVIIISEEVAKDEDIIRQIVDGINRDYLLNKKIQIVVVKGLAEDFIANAVKAKRQESVEGPLYGLLLNEQGSSSFTPKNIAGFINDMDICNASITPLAIPLPDDLEIRGGGVFKNYKLVGYIDEKENHAIAILLNEINEDVLQAEYESNSITALGSSFKTKRKLIEGKEDLSVLFTVEVEAQLHEYTLTEKPSVNTIEVTYAMEKALEDGLKLDLEMAIESMQNEYKADILHIGDYIRKFHPKIWEQLEPDWEKIFSKINIMIEVDVKLRRRGLIK